MLFSAIHAFRERATWFLRRRLASPEQLRHIVFRHSGEFDPPLYDPVEDGVITVRSPEELARFSGLEQLCDLETARAALLDGDVVRLIAHGDRAVAIAFEGHREAWFVTLSPSDRVIYSVATARDAMKRGLSGKIVQRIARDAAANGGAAWLDCALWNTRAHGAFTRAGFVRHDALTYPPLANIPTASFREIGGCATAVEPVAAPELSIITVNFRSADRVLDCLASLHQADQKITFEVIVVDNDSGDDGAGRIKAAYPQVRVLQMTRNVGFGAGNNAGLSVARGKYLLLLNPDTEMPEGVLRTVCDRLAADPQIGVIGVSQDVGGGRIATSALRGVTPIHYLVKAFLPASVIARTFPRYNSRYQERDPQDEFECEAVVGFFMAMRREVVEAVGGLDPRIFMYAEELEFCHRLRRAGYKVLYMGGLSVVHHHGATTRSIPIWRDVQMQQGQLVYIGLTQGKNAARLAGATMSVSHLVRLPIELAMLGSLWKARLESRLKRLRRSLKAMISPPARTRQAID